MRPMLDLSETEARPAQRSSWALTGLAVVSVCAFMALYITVGADCYWVVAMRWPRKGCSVRCS